MNLTYICSIDIGKKNFSICVEQFDKKELIDIENIPQNKKYKEDGTPTLEMENILEQLYSNGKIILHDNVDLTYNCDQTKKLDPETFYNMIDVLDKYIEIWDKCDAFVIEEQMSFGKKLNKMAVKLGQHCYSYFTFKYGRFKTIIEFPAFHKTQILGAPKIEGQAYKSGKKRWKAMEKPQRKKWSINKAIEILNGRGEIDILENLTNVKKRDDLADVITQLQAFKYLVYVEKKL